MNELINGEVTLEFHLELSLGIQQKDEKEGS